MQLTDLPPDILDILKRGSVQLTNSSLRGGMPWNPTYYFVVLGRCALAETCKQLSRKNGA